MPKAADNRVQIDGRFVLNSAREGVRTFFAPIRGIVDAVTEASRPAYGREEPKLPAPPTRRSTAQQIRAEAEQIILSSEIRRGRVPTHHE